MKLTTRTLVPRDGRYKAGKMDLASLLPTLRDFLISQLTSDGFGPELSLKEYL